MTIYALRKGCLVVLAWCLGTLAVLLLVLRLLASQADVLTPRLEAFLQMHLDAPVSIETLAVAVEREGLRVDIRGINAGLPDAALFSLKKLRLRLDVWRSLRALAPVFSQARMDGFTLHLYRGEGLAWDWPDPATLPLYLAADPTIDLNTIDTWTRLILRQRLWVTDTRVLMHDGQDNATLHAPELVLSGSEERIRLAGAVAIAPTLLSEGEPELPVASLKADVRPGSAGLSNFSAALQLDMELEQLSVLAELIRPDYVPRLTLSGGRSRLWGRWHSGRLDDARLQLDMPQVVLSQADDKVVLNELHARGQWRREGDGGDAWLSGDVAGAERTDPARHKAPALPKHWHLTHGGGDWQLRTGPFELDSLVAWRDYMILPESVTRPLQALAPRGQVTGLQLGQHSGEWRVDAALRDLAVSPWEGAPGGGPLDAWVQARDLRGRVAFSGAADSSLYFPQIFNQPMELDRADGEVRWVYDGPDTLVSGRRLRADWNGARVQGEFGLTSGGSHEQLGLDLAFQNVDAIDTPLVNWLPMKVLDESLGQWLADGVGGQVERGTLKLATPIDEAMEADDINILLSLDITQGTLPIAPEWPQLTDIEGSLTLDQDALEASVAQAQSHGVRATDGKVELDLDARQLRVSGALDTDAEALKAFFQAAPVLDDSRVLDDIEAQGDAQGDISLALSLDAPDTLTLDVSATPRLSQLIYTPLGVAVNKVHGDIAWQQRGEQGALTGTANGELLGGEVSANFTPDQVAFDGRASAGELLDIAGLTPDAAARLASGNAHWQGTLALDESPSLRLQSNLEGIDIKLPAPFAKASHSAWPWTLEAQFDDGRIESRLGDVGRFRGRLMEGQLAFNLNLGTQAARTPSWPSGRGWGINAGAREIAPLDWRFVTELFPADAASGRGASMIDKIDVPLQLSLETSCVKYHRDCLGSVAVTGQRSRSGEMDLALAGSVLTGHLRYRPDTPQPVDVTVDQLVVDNLIRVSKIAYAASNEGAQAPASWLEAVTTEVPDPAAIPEWLTELPAGRLRVAEIALGEKRFGPLTAYWQARRGRFTLAPVGLTLGELSARGELSWQGDSATSETRANLTLAGGDVGSALKQLDQPVAMRSKSTQVATRLEWPGAPWQFALGRARGDLSVDVRDGRFLTLNSASARLVGLLNFDNIFRRLRLDFSDVTGKGTAFNRVEGKADVAGGLLRLRGPLTIDAPATTMRLTGSVDLLERELDQRLGVTLPISQGLPIAALAVGAPVVGGALFVANTLFGDAFERATTIHYRLEGPWASPDITLEGTQ
ncbi:MAG: DUF3971 domain-containing protein [Halomonas subglaciescola]|nr:DUF3971 domain-containing protein [Halomonas subglaciescola]